MNKKEVEQLDKANTETNKKELETKKQGEYESTLREAISDVGDLFKK